MISDIDISCIPPPPPPCNLQAAGESTNAICYGTCGGSVNLTVVGGTSPFSYNWSNSSTSEDVSGLCAGVYSVTVTDFYGCTATSSFNITQNSQIVLTTSEVNSTNCNPGCCNGSASVTATGGVSPYTYLWSTGGTHAAISNKCPGIYSVTVTDNAGCTASTTVTISCTPPPSCDGFRTQTMVGWGAVPNGGNPGVYVHSHFSTAFPSGLTVGGTACTGSHWLKLTTAQAVTDFLPSGGTPNKLLQNWTDPGGSLSNTLAGQVVAAALSIRFDLSDPNFSSNPIHLKDLYYNTGTFAGWTVQQVFDEANKKLSGCGSVYTYSQLTNALDVFNQNYDDGTTNLGKLSCTNPCAKSEDSQSQSMSLNVTTNADLNMSAYPNPFSSQTTIEFVASEDLTGSLELYTVTGVKLAVLYTGEIKAGQKYSFAYNADALASGMYFAKLTTNNGTAVQNIVKIH